MEAFRLTWIDARDLRTLGVGFFDTVDAARIIVEDFFSFADPGPCGWHQAVGYARPLHDDRGFVLNKVAIADDSLVRQMIDAQGGLSRPMGRHFMLFVDREGDPALWRDASDLTVLDRVSVVYSPSRVLEVAGGATVVALHRKACSSPVSSGRAEPLLANDRGPKI